jgi:hypothetical protein
MDSEQDIAEQLRLSEVYDAMWDDAMRLADLEVAGAGQAERVENIAERLTIAWRMQAAKRDPLNSPY